MNINVSVGRHYDWSRIDLPNMPDEDRFNFFNKGGLL